MRGRISAVPALAIMAHVAVTSAQQSSADNARETNVPFRSSVVSNMTIVTTRYLHCWPITMMKQFAIIGWVLLIAVLTVRPAETNAPAVSIDMGVVAVSQEQKEFVRKIAATERRGYN